MFTSSFWNMVAFAWFFFLKLSWKKNPVKQTEHNSIAKLGADFISLLNEVNINLGKQQGEPLRPI